jgi:hypothetical protein
MSSDLLAFDIVVVPEGPRSTDDREIAPGALTWRELPLPLMVMTTNDGPGHRGAFLAGRIEKLWREGDEIRGSGRFDDSEEGREGARLVGAQMLRWVSADIDIADDEVYAEGDCDPEEAPVILLADGTRQCHQIYRVVKGMIRGATAVPFPAFPQAVIVPAGMNIPPSTERGRPAVASVTACGDCPAPPVAWFANPNLPMVTPITLTTEGHVIGHLAQWGQCHIGRQDSCLTAPPGSSYDYFLTGLVECDDGSQVRVGQLTLTGGHADLKASHRAAAAHYDDTRSAVADVAVGEDAYGIWMAGALRPGVTAEQRRILLASGVSGDWRPIGGRLELVAACSVNVPGFPVARAASILGADGRREQTALVAAGFVPPADPIVASLRAENRALAARLEALERVVTRLRPQAVAALVASYPAIEPSPGTKARRLAAILAKVEVRA